MSSQPRQSENLGNSRSTVEAALQELQRERVIERIWQKEAALWTSDEAHQKVIRNSLGWAPVLSAMS